VKREKIMVQFWIRELKEAVFRNGEKNWMIFSICILCKVSN
jgi:hypothetical protein